MEDSEDSNGNEVEETEVLFMGLDTQASNSDSDMEGKLDLRVELVTIPEELEKCRKKNIHINLIISQLEAQLIDAKKAEEDLTYNSKEKYRSLKSLQKRSCNSRESLMKDLSN